MTEAVMDEADVALVEKKIEQMYSQLPRKQ